MSEPEYQVAVSAEEHQRAEELGQELPTTLPVLPLKETVVFPESMTPLAIGQERSIQLIDDVVGGDRLLALVTVRNDEADVPTWDDLYDVGTAAVVHKMIRVPDGTMRILVQGLRRVRLERRVLDDPYLVGEFVEVPDRLEETKEVEALTRNVQTLFGQIVALAPYLPEELQIAAANVDDPSALCYLVASTIRLKTEEKQKLLELVDVEARLREVLLILNREQEVFELGTRIQSQIQSELDHLELPVQDPKHVAEPFVGIGLLEQRLLLLGLEPESGGDEVRERARLVHVCRRELELGREIRDEGDQAAELVLDAAGQRLELGRLLDHVGYVGELADQVRLVLDSALKLDAADPLDEDPQRSVGDADHLVHDRGSADLVEVVPAGLLRVAIPNGDESQHPIGRDDVVHELDRALLADRERRDRLREDDSVLERQDRQRRGNLDVGRLELLVEVELAHACTIWRVTCRPVIADGRAGKALAA